jgi:Holliday junction resolvase
LPKKLQAKADAGTLTPGDLIEATPEADLQRQIMAYLAACGWLAIRFNSAAVKTEGRFFRAYWYMMDGQQTGAGFPDVLALRGNRAVLIEVKKKGERLRESQRKFHIHAERFGIEVFTMDRWELVEELKKVLDNVSR